MRSFAGPSARNSPDARDDAAAVPTVEWRLISSASSCGNDIAGILYRFRRYSACVVFRFPAGRSE